MAKDKTMVKHLHLTDNFGYADTHLPPGMGNVPIKGMLINSVKEPLEQMGANVEFETTVMTPEELQRFLELEQKAWKGGI